MLSLLGRIGVGFGLSRVLMELKIIESVLAYGVMVLVLAIDGYLLYVYFTQKRLPVTSSAKTEGSRCP